jgi:hypothetical protein
VREKEILKGSSVRPRGSAVISYREYHQSARRKRGKKKKKKMTPEWAVNGERRRDTLGNRRTWSLAAMGKEKRDALCDPSPAQS